MQASTSWDDVAFSSTEGDRHLGIRPVSQLNTWPVASPVNASRLPSRAEPRASLGVGAAGSAFFLGGFHLLFFFSFLAHVAVGTAVTSRPPHRSRRALLTHRAPPSGFGVEAVTWQRV